jgi:nickel-dependent lactate racemase
MYTLQYGNSKLSFDLPSTTIVDEIMAVNPACHNDPIKAVKDALDKSLVGALDLKNYKNASRVSIIINDKTRPVPFQHLLPPLLDKLISSGIPGKNIKFIIGTGTHLPILAEEIKEVYPEYIYNNYDIYSHNCDHLENLVDLGITKTGTPVLVNRQYYESDLKIVTGNIEPHHFMGFSGGNKSASIGVTGRATINKNHAMLIDPMACMGEYYNNPMRQDVEEIGKMIGTHFALNAVLNSEKKIVKVIAGDPIQVMEEGIQVVKDISQVKIDQLYDLTIASPGGYPKDINLYQAQKALTHSSVITKDNGCVILVAECREGSGSKSFEAFMEDVDSCEAAFTKFKKIGFSVGPHKAFQIAREAIRKHIILVSGIDPVFVRKWFMEPAATIEEAIQKAFYRDPNIKRCAVMPGATNTIALFN